MTEVNWASLKSASLELSAPFRVTLEDGRELCCEQIYRHLPGKRLVFRGREGGRVALIKAFFKKKHFEREVKGLSALASSGVAFPKEEWRSIEATQSGQPVFLLATEFLEDAITLKQHYEDLEPEALQPALSCALETIGRLHRAGIKQRDIHLGNFLLSDNRLHVIDGDGITSLDNKALDNLALFLAQMTPNYDRFISDILPAYGDAFRSGKVAAAVIKMRRKCIEQYLGKTVRDCTRFSVEKSASAFVSMRRDLTATEVPELLAQPEKFISQGKVLKAGNSATVVGIDVGEQQLVLKCYNIKNLVHGLSRCWRPSRAWISWQSAHRLKLLGIGTPQPLGFRENRVGPLRREAYLLTARAQGTDLRTWVEKNRNEQEIPEWLLQAASDLFDTLWQASVSHGDTKATNLFVVGESLEVIDLDAVRRHSSHRSLTKAHRKDLKRFLANWQGATLHQFERALCRHCERVGLR